MREFVLKTARNGVKERVRMCFMTTVVGLSTDLFVLSLSRRKQRGDQE